MPHHLVLLLGTGPLKERQADPRELLRTREYRTATYALDNHPETAVNTPFVGEALLRLHPATFDRVHLLGTSDSMWDTLALHYAQSDEEAALYYDLAEAVRDRSLTEDAPALVKLASLLYDRFGVPVHPGLLPLPTSETATWAMLERMAALPHLRDGDTLSLDVTHGLRVQPLFLLLALRYLQAVRPSLRLGHVFYGALDLQRDGIAPIYDLRPHVALLDWIDAARAFDRSADAGPLTALLTGDNAEAVLADKAIDLTRTLQANALPLLRGGANAFLSALRNVPNGHATLDLVRPALERLPRQINAGASWEALLFVAEHHAEHGRLGLALLAAWEAARARVADAYDQGGRPLTWDENRHIDALLKKVSELDQLRRDRNAVAHATLYGTRADGDRLRALRSRVSDVLARARTFLEGQGIDDAIRHHPWGSLAES